jgi:hypothetical protein
MHIPILSERGPSNTVDINTISSTSLITEAFEESYKLPDGFYIYSDILAALSLAELIALILAFLWTLLHVRRHGIIDTCGASPSSSAPSSRSSQSTSSPAPSILGCIGVAIVVIGLRSFYMVMLMGNVSWGLDVLKKWKLEIWFWISLWVVGIV